MQATLSGSTSIYLQIADMVEDTILKNMLLEEEQAPSTNELSRIYAINPATAAKGLNLLADDGILYKKRGLGMFVATGAREKILEKRRQSFYQGFVCPLAEEARNLGLAAGDVAAMLNQALAEDGPAGKPINEQELGRKP